MSSEINLKRLIPVALVALLYFAYVANGVNKFIFGMWDNSLRNPAAYSNQGQQTQNPAAVLPKATYLCDPPQKTPWIGCFIQ